MELSRVKVAWMASQLAYPVRVEARLDDNPPRWLWLVK